MLPMIRASGASSLTTRKVLNLWLLDSYPLTTYTYPDTGSLGDPS